MSLSKEDLRILHIWRDAEEDQQNKTLEFMVAYVADVAEVSQARVVQALDNELREWRTI